MRACHWNEALSCGLHVTFGEIHGPREASKDPELAVNGIVVPLEGAGVSHRHRGEELVEDGRSVDMLACSFARSANGGP